MTAKYRRSRSELFASAPPINQWPTIKADLISEEHKEVFNYRVKAITLYADGRSISEILEQTGVRSSLLNYLSKRCIEMHPDGSIWGFRALVPNVRMKDYTRSSVVKPKRPEAQGGHSGALRQILDRFPNVENKIIAWIRKKDKENQVYEHRIRVVDLHREFLNILRSLGVQNSEWPFNTKHQGLRTIYKFLAEILETDFELGVAAREDGAAKAHLNVGKEKSPILRFEDPFDAVEIDAHHIDAHLTVGFKTPQGKIAEVVLSRLWLLAMLERASTTVIAYSIVYRSEVSADDIIRLLAKAVNGNWKPKELTIPNLSYLPGSGFPSAVIPSLSGAVWGSLLLDGALAHLAKSVHERARKKLGNSLNWGPVRHFERRPNVERLFKGIHDDLFGRFPSTTGSNPQNGRAENGELLAEKYKIRAEDIEQLVDVYCAGHNATPSEGLCFISPLEYLRQSVDDLHYLPRKIPNYGLTDGPLFPLNIRVQIRGDRENGRRAYIQYERVRYTSDILAKTSGLIGKKISLEVDEDDLRQVKAYLENGSSIGFLKAMGRWSLSKHDLKTRKAINSLASKRIIFLSSGRDPVQVYLDHLSTAMKSNKLKNQSVPTASNATEAARVAKDANKPLEITQPISQPPPVSAPSDKNFHSLMTQPLPNLVDIINRRGK